MNNFWTLWASTNKLVVVSVRSWVFTFFIEGVWHWLSSVPVWRYHRPLRKVKTQNRLVLTKILQNALTDPEFSKFLMGSSNTFTLGRSYIKSMLNPLRNVKTQDRTRTSYKYKFVRRSWKCNVHLFVAGGFRILTERFPWCGQSFLFPTNRILLRAMIAWTWTQTPNFDEKGQSKLCALMSVTND